MVFAQPEGTAVFCHRSLAPMFNPLDPEEFYSYILLEVVTNVSYHSTYFAQDLKLVPRHDRAGYEILDNPPLDPAHIRYSCMTAMLGPERDKIRRSFRLQPDQDYHVLEGKCRQTHVQLIPVPMPTEDEKYLWLDLTYPLRGIYLPKEYISGENPNFSEYLQLQVRRRGVHLHRVDSDDPPVFFPRDEKYGWRGKEKYTVVFDIKHIYSCLLDPDERLADEYQKIYRFVRVCDQGSFPDIKCSRDTIKMKDGVHYEKVISDLSGLNLDHRKKGDPDCAPKVIIGVVGVILGCVPIVGPLLTLACQLASDVIFDLSSFKSLEGLMKKIPNVLTAVVGASALLKSMLKALFFSWTGTVAALGSCAAVIDMNELSYFQDDGCSNGESYQQQQDSAGQAHGGGGYGGYNKARDDTPYSYDFHQAVACGEIKRSDWEKMNMRRSYLEEFGGDEASFMRDMMWLRREVWMKDLETLKRDPWLLRPYSSIL